ncbi:MAG: hypothetical protein HY271_11310 [Deltaproteobacteria bacterium]|nr:hypothetical protein [Deltaproteobacteria bacterium]
MTAMTAFPVAGDAAREYFDFYGVGIEVGSTSPELVEEVRRDFAYFHRPASNPSDGVCIEVRLASPPYDTLPPLRASVFTPRNVCFRDTHVTYIDYFGQALAVFERATKRCVVYGTDPDLLHEIVYLFILSTVGQALDARGIHRVHALGVSHRGRGILLLLPSGGGKSTMALELMRRPEFLLLGEDTPLIDRAGRILPFPLRLGVRPDQKIDVPPQYLRTVRRMEFNPKTLIDIEYVRDRIGGVTEPSLVLVGERNLGATSEIVPMPRHEALKALVKYLIVGLGIYQGMEFLLERGLWELTGKLGVAASRLRNGVRLLGRAPAHRFVLGRDIAKNYETLLAFLERS